MLPRLPIAPDSVADESGHPRFGTYEGSLADVDFGQLGGAFRASLPRRLAHRKRWLYTFAATPEVIALFAIIDLNYSASAFAFVVDRERRKVLFDRGWLSPPGPLLVQVSSRPRAGLSARFRAVGAQLSCGCPAGGDRYRVDVGVVGLPMLGTGLRWRGELLLAGGPPPITVISPVTGAGGGAGAPGLLNVTQKAAALLTFGTLEAAGRRFVLDGGVGGMDYTHGLLARHTSWRWAFGCGRLFDGTPVAFNLVEGINDSAAEVNENAVWIGQRLVPVGRAQFIYNRADVLDPWTVRTEDGAVELSFRPIAAHREHRALGVVRSAFSQPVGTFDGRLVVDGHTWSLRDLAGVTEEQDALW